MMAAAPGPDTAELIGRLCIFGGFGAVLLVLVFVGWVLYGREINPEDDPQYHEAQRTIAQRAAAREAEDPIISA